AFTFLENFRKVVFRDQVPGKPDAFVEPREAWRGIGVNLVPHRLQPGADHRLGRALAVGAGDVDHRRQRAFGVAERGKKPPHAVEREVDDLRMQRHHPGEDQIGTLGHAGPHRDRGGSYFASALTASGYGRSPFTAGDYPVSILRLAVNSSFSALQCGTRSSIPWSI